MSYAALNDTQFFFLLLLHGEARKKKRQGKSLSEDKRKTERE